MLGLPVKVEKYSDPADFILPCSVTVRQPFRPLTGIMKVARHHTVMQDRHGALTFFEGIIVNQLFQGHLIPITGLERPVAGRYRQS